MVGRVSANINNLIDIRIESATIHQYYSPKQPMDAEAPVKFKAFSPLRCMDELNARMRTRTSD